MTETTNLAAPTKLDVDEKEKRTRSVARRRATLVVSGGDDCDELCCFIFVFFRGLCSKIQRGRFEMPDDGEAKTKTVRVILKGIV